MFFDNHKNNWIWFLIIIVYPQIILFNVYLLIVHFAILIKNWLYFPN